MHRREVGTMGIVVERVSADQARARKRVILRELKMSRDKMKWRAESFQLNAHQRGLAREYERLEFLVPDAR